MIVSENIPWNPNKDDKILSKLISESKDKDNYDKDLMFDTPPPVPSELESRKSEFVNTP